MKSTLTVTEAARNFSDVVNRVYYRGETMELTRGGKVVARLVPTDSATLTCGEVLEVWDSLSHLDPEEAESFAADVEAARNAVNVPPIGRWD